MMARKTTSDAMEIIEGMIGDDAETRELYEQFVSFKRGTNAYFKRNYWRQLIAGD